ncbi:15070_t:CDS:2 [Funneliformis geosporum]|uniref:15070_t:CDS:1 n=1 Tax=Funneliformis geosporum TaxID=1117311 RepID=A0A9W4WPC4_9GLOM|nr:15070_t:CDS:2 [Funneliformis geosporum]
MGFYYTKLKKIARYANMRDNEFHHRFLEGLSSENQIEARHKWDIQDIQDV